MKLNRRTLAASAVLAPLASTPFLRAAGAQTPELPFDHWHRFSGSSAESIDRIAQLFNESNESGYAVTAISQGDIQELNQKVRTAAAGGGLPGSLMGDDYDITQYTSADIIVDLDPYIQDPEVGFTQEELDSFIPNQLDRHKLDIYDGRRMAMPQAFSAFATWWNVEALQAAGYEKPVETWQEFPDFARALQESNPDMVVYPESAPGDRFISIMKTYGVEWLKEDGATANFDSPEALEIMTWWKECFDEGLIQFVQEGVYEMFAAGESFLFMASSAYIPELSIATIEYNAGLPPQGQDNSSPMTETYGPINCIPATDEETQRAAWAWLKFLTTPQAYEEWIPGTSYFPAIPSVAESPELSWYYDENPVALKLLEEVAPVASILAPHPALTEVRGTITANVVNEVMLGQLAPEEGCQKLQAEAQDAIERASAGSS